MRKVGYYVITFFLCAGILYSQTDMRGLKVIFKSQAGKRWAICIGIDNYVDKKLNTLKKASNDAYGLSKVLEERGDFEVYVFSDRDKNGNEQSFRSTFLPTKKNIEKFLIDLVELGDIKPNDLVVFSFSGHGISDKKGNGYLLPLDWDSERFFESAIPVSTIVTWVKSLSISKSLVMIDACRERMTSSRSLEIINRLYEEKFQSADISAILYATKQGGFSYEDPESNYGAFTKYIIDGLQGNGDINGDELVTFRELSTYVEDGLGVWARKNGYKQRPYTRILEEQSGDLALTIVPPRTSQPIKIEEQQITRKEEKTTPITSHKESLIPTFKKEKQQTFYISGKGDQIPGGGHPATFPDQVKQCLENVKSTLKLAGMDMQNVVKAWVFLDDLSNFAAMNEVFKTYFPKDPPARTTLQVGKIPGDSHIEITCIAYGDLAERKVVAPPDFVAGKLPFSPGILAGTTLYIAGKGDQLPDGKHPATFPEQVKQCLENVGETLKDAGLSFKNVVWSNVYLDNYENMEAMNKVYSQYFEFGNTPARGTIFVDKMPGDSHVEITCIATTDLAKRKSIRPSNMEPSATASPAIMAGDMLYLSAKSGFIPGKGIVATDLEGQLRQTFQNLLDGLKEAGLGFEDVVSANVYLKDLKDFDRMNKIFKQYFSTNPPVRTTIQHNAGYEKNNVLEQISLIATRTKKEK